MLYEVAIIQKPTAKEQETGVGEKLILAPVAVVATDERTAVAQATKQVTEDLSRATVLVRPFA